MADPNPPPRPAAAGRRPLGQRMTAAVAERPRAALAAIIVLAVLVIGLYLYYHGFMSLGPWAGRRRAALSSKVGAGAEGRDAETERLIETLNRQ